MRILGLIFFLGIPLWLSQNCSPNDPWMYHYFPMLGLFIISSIGVVFLLADTFYVYSRSKKELVKEDNPFWYHVVGAFMFSAVVLIFTFNPTASSKDDSLIVDFFFVVLFTMLNACTFILTFGVNKSEKKEEKILQSDG